MALSIRQLSLIPLRFPHIFRQTTDLIEFKFWWMNLLLNSTDLINFGTCTYKFPLFPGLRFVEQFPYICKQTACRIGLRFGRQTHGTPRPDYFFIIFS